MLKVSPSGSGGGRRVGSSPAGTTPDGLLLFGAYKNGGKEYQPQGSPVPTSTHDFPGEAGKAVPYGVYDVGANSGWVNVGVSADTAMFAVESIRRRRRRTIGSPAYPDADPLLITADSGGSNGSRLLLRKTQLAELATETGLRITVCHLPPGTSKWNKIEHRGMSSYITLNWRGRPLETHEVVVADHRGDHHQDRTEHPSRPRHLHLPERHQDHRQSDESLQRPPTCNDTCSTATGTTLRRARLPTTRHTRIGRSN